MPYITLEDRAQKMMFPAYLVDYISEENPVRIVDVFIDKLDMPGMGFARATPANEGRPGLRPAGFAEAVHTYTGT